MSIKCGNGHQHDTVQQVRECYGVKATTEAPRATDAQLKFLNVLRQERGLGQIAGNLRPTKQDASRQIDDLIRNVPKAGHPPVQVRQASARTASTVPEGYYATKSATGNNDLDFWHVDRPTEGKWAGYVFVRRILGGKSPTRINRAQQNKALAAIESAGADKAAVLFGQELGRCAKCGRHLTDDASRQRGYGPECFTRMSS